MIIMMTNPWKIVACGTKSECASKLGFNGCQFHDFLNRVKRHKDDRYKIFYSKTERPMKLSIYRRDTGSLIASGKVKDCAKQMGKDVKYIYKIANSMSKDKYMVEEY